MKTPCGLFYGPLFAPLAFIADAPAAKTPPQLPKEVVSLDSCSNLQGGSACRHSRPSGSASTQYFPKPSSPCNRRSSGFSATVRPQSHSPDDFPPRPASRAAAFHHSVMRHTPPTLRPHHFSTGGTACVPSGNDYGATASHPLTNCCADGLSLERATSPLGSLFFRSTGLECTLKT